ncbi:FxsA family protein [Stagnihabitans tardus]|uniref:FxsA family protein n=1 Tax=Stagnihabitans tardus TaxID=2699202 RepID=A0AAE4YBB9_9RHOB|nr:FxsA family protein [Stagnihabitans tardus]NBZ86800.1 FxsA family protein [Stagnihabitans tardus]
MRVILGLLAWSLVEIGLFVVIGGAIGVWATWGVVLGSGVLGVLMIRGAMPAGRSKVIRVEDVAGPLAHSILRGLAGVLLILPGFLTDLIGLCLLIPAIREVIIARIRQRFPLRTSGFQAAQDDIIDGEAIEIEASRLEKPSGWTKP